VHCAEKGGIKNIKRTLNSFGFDRGGVQKNQADRRDLKKGLEPPRSRKTREAEKGKTGFVSIAVRKPIDIRNDLKNQQEMILKREVAKLGTETGEKRREKEPIIRREK